jgi:hypothetical protein
VTFIGVVPKDVVELTPLSIVFIKLHITLLFLLLGMDIMGLKFLSLSFVM